MISSKRIGLITGVLVIVSLVLVILAMTKPWSNKQSNTDEKSYSDIHKITFNTDDYYSPDLLENAISIVFDGATCDTNSSNVKVDKDSVTILAGGVYKLAGNYTGSVIVDSKDDNVVFLFFDGVSIDSNDYSPLYIKKSNKTILSIVPDTVNTFTDAKSYSNDKLDKNDSSACIYSKDDLTINGEGTLIINANYKDGIKCNDTLKITQANIEVDSVDDAINANDALVVNTATITISSGGNGVMCKSDNDAKGFVVLDSSSVKLDCTAKGIKASSAIYFDDGTYQITSTDDAIHAEANIIINDGDFILSTEDDAIHSGDTLTIKAKTINISTCYEGLEAKYVIIDDGDISIVSKDDSINAVGENNNSGGFGGPGGGASEAKVDDDDFFLTINGGNLYLETSGDGIDSNGSVMQNGGYIQVYGPENGANSSLDFGDGGYQFVVNGGTLVAAGNSGMAEELYSGSTQPCLNIYLEQTYAQNSSIVLTNSSGTELINALSTKQFDYIGISSPAITIGETYTLTVNGEAIDQISVEEMSTTYGTKSGFGGGHGPFGDRPDGFQKGQGDGETPPTPPDGTFDPNNMPTPPDGTFDPNNKPTPPDGDFNSNKKSKQD